MKKSEGIAGAVWESGKILVWDTSENPCNFIRNKEAKKAGILTIFGLPLFYKDRLSGVLVLGSREEESLLETAVFSENFSRQLGAEIRRKQLEQELEQIFNYAPDIIAISDFRGYFKKLNPAASNLLGYTEKELMLRPFVEFLHPDDRSNTIDRINAPRNNATYYIEERYITKLGKTKWLAWTSHSIEDQEQVFSVAKDITEKKNLEDLLAKSNSLARIGSWEIDVIKGTVYWSDVTKEIREVDVDFNPTLDIGIEYFKQDVDKITIRKKVNECIEYGRPWDEELEILTFKGNPKWIRTIGQAEMIEGKCVRIFGSFQDIDVRKRAEVEAGRAINDLEESEKRYSDLFQLSPLPMWVYDFETLKFLDVNQTATKHYGYSFKEFMEMTIRQIRPEDEVPALEDAIKLTTKKKLHFYQGVFRHKKNNGEVISVEVKSNVIDFKGRKAKVVVINDITERLRYFDAIEKQNVTLREISWIQSHVVRAPLAKLMSFVSLLENKTMQKKEKQNYLMECVMICAEELDSVIKEITKKSDYQEKLKP